MLKSLIVAFAMYSGIPMPQSTWNEESLKDALIFFPVVGLFLGGVLYGESLLLKHIGAYPPLAAGLIIYTALKVTGGIHLDGLMDAADAEGSWGNRKKKLEIMKDSHIGAFAAIGLITFMMLLYGAVLGLYRGEADKSLILIPAIGRALSGYAISKEKPAKESGLAYLFHNAADKERVRRILIGEMIVFSGVFLYAERISGAVILFCMLVVYGRYIRKSKKDYGGITGDLAGDFLCKAEVTALIAACLLGGIL